MQALVSRCYDPIAMVDDGNGPEDPREEVIRELSEQLAQRERELSVLADVAFEVHSTESVQSVFEIALDKVRETLGLSAAWILTGDEEDRKLHLAAARGISEAYVEELRRNGPAECLCQEVFWSGHTMQVRNTIQCPRMPAMLQGVSATHACIPLRFRGGSRGVLNVAGRGGASFSEGELRFLETLGHQISLAVERARRGEAERERHEEARTAYRELRAAQEKIIESEKMALLGTFAAGLAHEIRNPLNSIALQLAVIERRQARAEKDMGIGELIGVIREEVSRLDALAGDFLQFSRADRIQQGFANLDTVIDHVLTLLEPQSSASGVKLHYRRSPHLPPLPIDAEKMKQVMINLVRNSIEAMTAGGEVTVAVVLQQDAVLLTVEDSGPGLPEGVDIFQIFTTTKPGGTGLGLSIARQIIASHGGVIQARNAEGGGALFELQLPLAPKETP